MKLLLDHNLPRRLRTHLVGHDVKTTHEMHWEELDNGELTLVPFVPHVQKLLAAGVQRSLYIVALDGSVTRLP